MKKNIKYTVLTILAIAGFVMMVSEGSTYCWANLAGMAIFGSSAHLLGLFRGPYDAD